MDNTDKIPSPCFVLEAEALKKNLTIFEELEQSTGINVLCALKGFAFYHVFDRVAKSIHGATASSLNEALLASKYFNQVHVCAPIYIEQEFQKISEIASHITFNSLSQYKRYINRITPKNTALLRINPEYSEVSTDLYNPCKSDSRLGVTRKELDEFGGLPAAVEGLHIHALCENDSFTFERLLEKLEERFAQELKQIKYLNIGGGHLVTKSGYDLEHFKKTVKSLSERYNIQVIMEPGSAFGWQTGYLLSTIIDIVKKEDITIFMLDVSFSAHMPDTLEMPYKPSVVGMLSDGKYKIRLGGNTCLAGDEMGEYYLDELPKIGDHVIFEDMIHYTTVKTTTFNGVNLPSIGMTENNTFKMLKQPGYSDYISRL